MPKKDTHFCSKWYQKLDSTKYPCSRWLKQGKSTNTFLCTVCNEEKSCRNGGWSDVYKHSQRPKHVQRFKDVIESGQLIATTSSFLQLNTPNERVLTQDEKVTRAEAYWAMATAKLGLSYNSSQYIQELFSRMFPDSNIAKEFSMKPRKLSYILSHGTGHYFTKVMLNDLTKAPGFTLIFDETTIVGVRKQLDLHFRYWCEKKQAIVVRYYKSIFLGHATAEILFRNMIDALRADGIDLTKILMLGRDNPNVNKVIEKMMDKEIRIEREKQSSTTIKSNPGLIHIGSCPLHLIHNSFKAGMDNTNWLIEEFLNDLVSWFSRSPSRREDYIKVAKSVSDDIGKFIRRFIITRWLEIGPILERIIEQWLNLKEYFLQFIPINNKISLNNHRYIQIKTILETKSTLIRLNFLVFLYYNVFKQILVWFQQTQPLIHLLYDECEQLIRRLFAYFINEDLIQNKSLKQLIHISYHIQTNQKCDLNYYWKNVFTLKTNTGKDKFLALNKLVKCALALSHGNADVERGFSENAFLLTDDRSLLSNVSINGLRATRDGVKFFGDGKPHDVPVTKDLLDSVRDAHSRYCSDLEKQREELLIKKNIEEEQTTKNLLGKKENNLCDEQKDLHENLSNIQKMIDEGTERLAKAITKRNFEDIETAQLLIEGGNKKLAMINTQIVFINNQLNQMRKKQKK